MSLYEAYWKMNKACATGNLEWDIPNVTLKTHDNVVDIVLLSDVHIGAKAFRLDLFQHYIDYIAENDIYVALLGDLMEFAIPVHMPFTMFEQDVQVPEQIRMVRKFLEPIKDKIIYMTNGNHENRQWKKTGVDLSEQLAEHFGCFYSKAGGLLSVNVGKQNYLFSLHHGHSNAQSNLWAENEKRWLAQPEVDLVALGHVHHLAHKAVPKFTYADGKVGRRYVHFVRTGSFLSGAAYAMEVGYPPTLDGAPIVTLSANTKLIEVDCRGETIFDG